jgi:hypothetical protein
METEQQTELQIEKEKVSDREGQRMMRRCAVARPDSWWRVVLVVIDRQRRLHVVSRRRREIIFPSPSFCPAASLSPSTAFVLLRFQFVSLFFYFYFLTMGGLWLVKVEVCGDWYDHGLVLLLLMVIVDEWYVIVYGDDWWCCHCMEGVVWYLIMVYWKWL